MAMRFRFNQGDRVTIKESSEYYYQNEEFTEGYGLVIDDVISATGWVEVQSVDGTYINSYYPDDLIVLDGTETGNTTHNKGEQAKTLGGWEVKI